MIVDNTENIQNHSLNDSNPDFSHLCQELEVSLFETNLENLSFSVQRETRIFLENLQESGIGWKTFRGKKRPWNFRIKRILRRNGWTPCHYLSGLRAWTVLKNLASLGQKRRTRDRWHELTGARTIQTIVISRGTFRGRKTSNRHL